MFALKDQEEEEEEGVENKKIIAKKTVDVKNL